MSDSCRVKKTVELPDGESEFLSQLEETVNDIRFFCFEIASFQVNPFFPSQTCHFCIDPVVFMVFRYVMFTSGVCPEGNARLFETVLVE